jgi:predicted hotdog family 3-hydroxylacyl-ACP dehydratase
MGRDWLAANLPHAGAMNLLESVVEWDPLHLAAIATSHRDARNPLRREGMLPITSAIEYAAQAAAAHGALVEARPSGEGMLVAIRAVEFHAARLDDIAANLDVEVEAMGGSDAGVMYRFQVASQGRAIASGRLTIAFRAGTGITGAAPSGTGIK